MKKIEIKFLKFYNVIIVGLLTALGFTSSCDSKDEYGTPSAKFIVKGKVESAENNDAIENIQIVNFTNIAKVMECIFETKKQENYCFVI